MKKLAIVLLFGLVLLTGCDKKAKPGIQQISLSEYFKMMDNGEDFVVYFGTSTCSACLQYKPVVEEVTNNYKVIIYFVELDSESKADKDRLLAEYAAIEFTPTTYFVVGGVNQYHVVGMINYRTLKQDLVTYGFITED